MTDKNIDNMDESSDDRQLGDLLRTLNRVEAPGDFDFKVKARIADTDLGAYRSRGWQHLPVYVYPLAIAVIVGSLFLFNEFYPLGGQAVQPVAGVKTDELPSVDNRSPSSVNPQQAQPIVGDQEVATTSNSENRSTGQENTQPRIRKTSPGSDRLPPGGSRDSSLGNTQQILPRGFDGNVNGKDITPPVSSTPLAITELMRYLGVDSKFDGQALKVTSVRGGSVGDRAGFKTGDIVETVDQTPITAAANMGHRIEAKRFTVLRGGQRIQLEIRVQ